MSRIHVLDEHLTNMIAAGEVVEKPMGVVKELVENSIDAQATRIIVRVVNGGRDMIEVSDDGIGMDQEDAVRAFSRHATSKILRSEDLWDIHTMGFRGEALPSIASVSKTSLLTSDGSQSTEIILEYGKIIKAGPAATARGTTLRVENLFLKPPASMNQLQCGNTEFNAIIDLMQKFALGNPQIAFELYADDKLKLQTPGNGSLDETMMHIYGLETAKNSIPVEFSDYDFSVKGVLVFPSINRSTKQYINCFINGRIVRSFLIQKAIIDAYREFMMPDRYPVCVLNIDVDYQLVDVNVHPSKWEIRLSKERQLCSLIQTNVNEVLKKQFKPGEIKLPKQNVRIEEKPLFETTYTEVRHDDVFQEKAEEYVPAERKEEPAVVVERFQYLAQLHGNYILACDEDNLYIVDQHAAMERCMYEDIQQEIENNDVMTQDLIVPLMIELTPAEIQQIDRLNEVFNAIGIEMEGFSNNSVLIRRVPLWFEDINEEEFIHDLVGEILNEKKMNVLDIRKDRIASLACHSSIKFNHHLDAMESRKLLSRLGRCVQPFNCPHGRPTMMAISEAQLQKEFKRVL